MGDGGFQDTEDFSFFTFKDWDRIQGYYYTKTGGETRTDLKEILRKNGRF